MAHEIMNHLVFIAALVRKIVYKSIEKAKSQNKYQRFVGVELIRFVYEKQALA